MLENPTVILGNAIKKQGAKQSSSEKKRLFFPLVLSVVEPMV